MAKMRDEESNFCNKIVILNTRVLPDCLWRLANLLPAPFSASCRSCSQQLKVIGGHQRFFTAPATHTPSVSTLIHSRPVATALGCCVDTCCILMGWLICSCSF